MFSAWGRETREAAVRVVTGTAGLRDQAANLEVKPVDLAANPYLALGCVIAAGVEGLSSATPLPEEITGDPARLALAEAAARGVRRLPTSLAEAVEEFRKDERLRAALGPVLADAVIAVRQGELAAVDGLDDDRVAAAYRWKYCPWPGRSRRRSTHWSWWTTTAMAWSPPTCPGGTSRS